MRCPLLALTLLSAAISAPAADNLLQAGDFSGAAAGSPPPGPWTLSKSRPNVSLVVEAPAGERGNWVRVIDESPEDAAVLAQKFPELTAGRLTFKLHVLRSGAAIWFLFGQKELGGRGDAIFGFKINSRGQLLVAKDSQKVADQTGAKAAFPGGQTYNLYCSFRPSGEGLEIEIGQTDGAVLFRGTGPVNGPVSALAIRTHGEESGSDFYVTDLSLTPESQAGEPWKAKPLESRPALFCSKM